MKQNLTERLRTSISNVSPEAEFAAYIAGAVIAFPFAITGAVYALAYAMKEIPKVVESAGNNPLIEYAMNNPYEIVLGVAGVAALGVGAYTYVERKLHVAKTLDDFVEKARKGKKPVEVNFQWEYGLENYGGHIKVSSGKVRHNYYDGQSEILCTVGSDSEFGEGMVGSGLLARGKATTVLSLTETAIYLAEHLEKKGLEVRINGGTIVNGPVSVDGAKAYLAACKEWVKSGHAFIIG